MDWSNEAYVKWYTRDTKTWMLLGWQGQAVLGFLMRKADRSGRIDDVADGADLAVIFANGMPPSEIQNGLDMLVKRDVVRLTDSGLIIVNFLDAQEASKSDALRQKESRARRRAGAMKQPSDRTGQVYFIQSENGGPVKIGFAVDVKSRISNIQTSRSDKVVLLATIDGTPELEASLHKRFSSSSIGGEWFSPSAELMEMIGVTGRDALNTGRDALNTGRDDESQAVTGGHRRSQPVTLTSADPLLSSADPKIPPNPPGGGAGRVETRDPTRPKPADPLRATFRTQCPDRFDFTEAHRGLARRGSIDISLEWRGFSKKAQASTKHLTDWGAAFEAHLSECVQRIERAAAYRATDRNAQRSPVVSPVASDPGDPATLGAPPVSQARPVANPDGSRKLRALIGGIG